jgi:hypothetical protein
VGVRVEFREVTVPPQLACCNACGALVDPAGRGRTDHLSFHEGLSDMERAARLLLEAVQRLTTVDLTREEDAAGAEREGRHQ